MKRILDMILSLLTIVLSSLMLVGVNCLMALSVLLVIRNVDIVLAIPTIPIAFIVLYVFNKSIWTTQIKDNYHDFMTILSKQKKCI